MTITNALPITAAPGGAGSHDPDAPVDPSAPAAAFADLLAMLVGAGTAPAAPSTTPAPTSTPALPSTPIATVAPASLPTGPIALPASVVEAPAMPKGDDAVSMPTAPAPAGIAPLLEAATPTAAPIGLPIEPTDLPPRDEPADRPAVAPRSAPPQAAAAAHNPAPPLAPAAARPLAPPLAPAAARPSGPARPGPDRHAAPEEVPLLAAPATDAPAVAPVTASAGPAADQPDTDEREPAPAATVAAAGGPHPQAATTSVVPSAPAAPTAPAAPLEAASVVHQLRAELAPLRDLGDGRYELHVDLHPVELGRVGLDVHVSGGSVHITIQAEHAMSHALLDHALPDLRAALEHAGLASADLHLAHHKGGGANERGHDDGTPRAVVASGQAIDELTPLPANRASTSDALDLLL